MSNPAVNQVYVAMQQPAGGPLRLATVTATFQNNKGAVSTVSGSVTPTSPQTIMYSGISPPCDKHCNGQPLVALSITVQDTMATDGPFHFSGVPRADAPMIQTGTLVTLQNRYTVYFDQEWLSHDKLAVFRVFVNSL